MKMKNISNIKLDILNNLLKLSEQREGIVFSF